MNERHAKGAAGAGPEHVHDPPDRDWLELKMLLIGREQRRLTRIEERLNSPEIRTEETGCILPEIIARGVEKNALGVSQALLLVIGPAIRSAISKALQEMLRNLDRLLKNSLSPTSWKWRLEALRTGKPFAEIALLHCLEYRVEQVFLVHRRTSLVIRYVQIPSLRGKDPDLVSAMLSAIQDFVQHSFESEQDAKLDTVQAGELTIWIEQGPLAFLAAAIRGAPPLELRAQLRATLDQIHVRCYAELQRFEGDTAPLERCTDPLQDCLVFQLHEEPAKKPVFALAFFSLLSALLLIALLGYMRDSQRWQRYVDELKKQPGIAVTSATHGIWRHSIAGLRDPLGADPVQMLHQARVDPKKVRADWRPYVSAAPELVWLRAKRRLNPPDGVSLAYEDGVLRVSGTAPAPWAAQAVKDAMSIPGIERVDARGFQPLESRDLEKQKSAVESITCLFPKGSATLTAQQREVAQRAASAIERLTKLADAAGKALMVRIAGHADQDGGVQENLELSRKRAEAVRTVLLSHGLKPSLFSLAVDGATRPMRTGASEAEKARDRSASFEVILRDRSADQDSGP